MKRSIVFLGMILMTAFAVVAQQPLEQRAALSEATVAFDGKAEPALEGHLLTQVLNGSDDSPVTNIKLAVKNRTANFYVYVSGWATFYDTNAVRCGEGLFKIDALAPQESVEVDTPGLRLRCAPRSWRISATNLLTKPVELPKSTEPPAAAAEPAPAQEKRAPLNFIISIDGEEHPIQVNNPITLKLGNRKAKIVLRSVP